MLLVVDVVDDRPGSISVNHYTPRVSQTIRLHYHSFPLITKETKEERIRYLPEAVGYMVVGSIVVAWIRI